MQSYPAIRLCNFNVCYDKLENFGSLFNSEVWVVEKKISTTDHILESRQQSLNSFKKKMQNFRLSM